MNPGIRKYRAAIFVWVLMLALLATLCRLAAREDYWLDEGYTVRRVATTWPALYAPLLHKPADPSDLFDPYDLRDLYDLNPPFYFATVRLLAGPAPGKLTLRLFSALPLLAGLALLADWARRELGARGALALLLAGATAPTLIYYGHEARPYAFGFMLAALLVWLGTRFKTQPGLLAALTLPAAAAGCLTHFAFAWFTIAFWCLRALAWLEARHAGEATERRAALAQVGALAGGALVAVLVMLPQAAILPICKNASSQVIDNEVLMATFAFPFCRVGSHPVPPGAGAALQGALVGAVLLLARRSPRGRQGLQALALWLFTMALPVIVYYWFRVAYFERYTIFSLTGWLMMLGWLAQETRWLAGWRRGAVGALFATMLLVSVGWAARNLGRPLRQEWRPMVEALRREGRPGDAYGLVPYFMRVVFAANAPSAPPPHYYDTRQAPPAGAARVWVVLDRSLNKGPLIPPDPARWRLEHVRSSYQLDLYRLERVK